MREPSEYFRNPIRIGSQPMNGPEKPEQMSQMLEMLHADETLIFCSDFSHFDWIATGHCLVNPKLRVATYPVKDRRR